MEEDKQKHGRLISSIDIINKTGISRATLNNYIRMGILPRPNVTKPLEATVRARKIGYFPDTVLDLLGQIKAMKKEGISMNMIMEKIKSPGPVQCSEQISEQQESKPNVSDAEKTSSQPVPSLSPQDAGDQFSSRNSIIQDLIEQRTPSLVSFCVLAAGLQDSARIRAELPPEEYFELISQICNGVEDAFKQYYGAFGTFGRDKIHLYFLKDGDPRFIMNALRCALTIRENIKTLNTSWQARKGWRNRLCLNIGLDEGREYAGAIPTASGNDLIFMGDAADHAGRLSDFASQGAIWATKNLMNGLTTEERAGIRFGISRIDGGREMLIENSFGRMMDLLPQGHPQINRFMDIPNLIITEIFEYR